MNFAIVENGIVVNVAVADAPLGDNWIASEVAAIGDTYADGEFVKPPPPTPVAPKSVTMRQGRLALLGAGVLDLVEGAIAAIEDPAQRKAAEIEWEYAQTIERDSAFTQTMAAQLGLTDAQLDGLFSQAASL